MFFLDRLTSRSSRSLAVMIGRGGTGGARERAWWGGTPDEGRLQPPVPRFPPPAHFPSPLAKRRSNSAGGSAFPWKEHPEWTVAYS